MFYLINCDLASVSIVLVQCKSQPKILVAVKRWSHWVYYLINFNLLITTSNQLLTHFYFSMLFVLEGLLLLSSYWTFHAHGKVGNSQNGAKYELLQME